MSSYDLYSSPNIISLIRRRSIRLAGHVARMRYNANVHRILLEKLKGKGRMSMGKEG